MPRNVIEPLVPSSTSFGVQLSSKKGERSKSLSKILENNTEKARKNNQILETQRKINSSTYRKTCYWLSIGMAVMILICTGSFVGMVWHMLKAGSLRTTTFPTSTTVKSASVPSAETTKLSHPLTTEQTTVTEAIQIQNTSFFVLRAMEVKYGPFDFLAVQIKTPIDGLSTSENWCRDYQYLCENFARRPTGCSGKTFISTSPYQECGDEYNSDMSISNVLGCNPANKIATISGLAFQDAKNSRNAFGFFQCGNNNCQKNITVGDQSLAYREGFLKHNDTIMYTLCR